MKRIVILLALLLTSCSAAFQERISTEHYSGTETEPSIEEHDMGLPQSGFGIEKRLTIHNPLPFRIRLHLTCDFIGQDDPWVEIGPHTTKWMFVLGGSRWRQGCFIDTYTVIYQ